MNAKLIATVALCAVAAEAVTTHNFAVSWKTTRQWAIDGKAAASIPLVAGETYAFQVPNTLGGLFILSGSMNNSNTLQYLAEADGVTNNMCDPPCTITYVPRTTDVARTVYYVSDFEANAGADIQITTCVTTSTNVLCENIHGCGWSKSCSQCSTLTVRDDCMDASGCSWCQDGAGSCMADTATPCSSHYVVPTKNKPPFWGWIILGVGLPLLIILIVVIACVASKASYAKKNNDMFKVEDEMSVLGGKSTDDNVL